MAFVRNTGQCHPKVAYVAPVEGALVEQYHGCGAVAVVIDENAEPLSISYELEQEAELEPGHYRIQAMASCYELVVDVGTPDAAVLTALVGQALSVLDDD